MTEAIVSLDEKLSESRESTLFRGRGAFGDVDRILGLVATSDRPTEGWVARVENEYQHRDVLARPWAARPLALVRRNNRMVLVLEDPGGDPLAALLERGLGLAECLRLGLALARCVSEMHAHGIIHKDIKPSNVLVDLVSDPPVASLTGFGIATRTAHERPEGGSAPEIAGTLDYMAPEQTGRMNRSIDFRSDLYTVGVVLYEAVVGALPFVADDPLDLIHCHVARTPVPPAERKSRGAEAIPAQLSAVIMKLLAKTPEDRYQTARGLEADLARCLTEWQVSARIPRFELGAADIPDRPLIAEQLYGREREVGQLISAWERAAAGGRAEVVLLSGAAGVGKSTLVGELRRAVLTSGALFAAGKLEDKRRGVPYATLAEPLRAIVRAILVKPEDELESWRRALAAAVGVNGRVVAELVPELELLLGEQTAIPVLGPRETQNRFRIVFSQFIETIATRRSPLVLFFDDLQWVDAASLELIAHVVAHPPASGGPRHLLFVGAYRDDEVAADHPLAIALPSLRAPGVATTELVLGPFALDDLASLVAAMLRTPRERVMPLVRLVHAQTGGNPFFAAQFVMALYEEGLLRLDAGAHVWTWELDRVRAKGFTDNVLDLLARTLMRLTPEGRETLKTLALLGMRATVDVVARALAIPVERARENLVEANLASLVDRKDDTYAFVHDRIREAACALIPTGARAEAHLRIARLLAGGRRADDIAEDELFAVSSHFNHALASIDDAEEREVVWCLNFRAAKIAQGAGVFHAARDYFRHARALLPDDAWQTRYGNTFATFLELAECEFLVGNVAAASGLLDDLLRQTIAPVDRAAVQSLR
ncbi:MAG: AAA family ATPase, partial [Myxococcales bacterium]